MWFEILPTFGIITVALTVPTVLGHGICKFWTGKIYRRTVETTDTMHSYIRDLRLTGNPYKLNGLEAIPDE